MNKKITFLQLLLAVFLMPAYSQMFGEVEHDEADTVIGIDYDRGFTAQIETASNLFQMTSVTFSDEQERDRRTGYNLINNYLFGNTSIINGTVVRFGYNANWYGGAFSVNKNGIGGVKAWVSFIDSKLKVSAGNDIGYSFADSQGAPAGLRIYDDHVRNVGEGEVENSTVDSNKNPDNITGGKGVLLELNLDPLTIAFAAGGNLADMGKVLMVRSGTYTQEPVFGHSIRYGINAGSKISNLAKVNVAYIFESEKTESQFTYNSAMDNIIAMRADAHIMTHQFGFFGSIDPLKNNSLGLTAGYAGVLVQYLDEFGVGSRTVMPQVLKHGINLAARYKTGNLTIRTDHNYSFWTDRNYRIFNLHKPNVSLRDWGLVSADTVNELWGEVQHSFLWNGFGVSYRFTPGFESSISARNLLRIDETSQFSMLNNYFSVELRSTFYFGSSAEAFMGIVCNHTARATNETLSARVGEFPAGFTPKDTFDTRFTLQIPIGFTVKLQRS